MVFVLTECLLHTVFVVTSCDRFVFIMMKYALSSFCAYFVKRWISLYITCSPRLDVHIVEPADGHCI